MNTETTEEDKTSASDKQQELSAYERLRQEVKKVLDQSLDALNSEKINQAIEHGQKVLKDTGEHTQEQVNKLAKNLRKDLLSTFKAVEPPVKEFTESAGGLFDLWRDKSGVILTDLARAVGDWSHQFSDKLDDMLRYHSGEMTHGGTFVCENCGQTMNLKKPAHLPPCPKCHKTEFRRA